jgi:hypothetical protein
MGGFIFVFPNSREAIAMSVLAVHRGAEADQTSAAYEREVVDPVRPRGCGMNDTAAIPRQPYWNDMSIPTRNEAGRA